MNSVTTSKILRTTKIFFAVVFVFLMGSVSGQISTLNTWTSAYHGTGNLSASYPVPTGSNSRRLLVVAIATSRTSTGARTITITYGGQALTSVNGDIASTTPQQHTQLYYLNEAGLDAASGSILAVTFGGGTVRVNDVFASVLDNVNQSSPITDSQTYSSGTSTTANPKFGTALTVNANDQAVEIICSFRSGSTNYRTITTATNWTQIAQQTYNTTGDGVNNIVANRAIPTTDLTDNSSTTISNATLASMTGMSINEAPKYFRSIATGNWNATTTWQQSYDNVTWTAATSFPTSADNLVTIQSPNTVTLTAAATTSSLTVNGGGTVDVSTFILTGTGTMTIASTGTLLVGGSSNFPTGFGTTTLNSGSTVNYDNAGPQTVSATTYSNLILSGSGAKTIATGTSVSDNLSISGATANINAGLNIGVGSLTLGGLSRINGTWGSTSSNATYQDNTYFAATTGKVNVSTDTRLTPSFSGITGSQSICYGTSTVTLGGTVSSGAVYPGSNEIVGITINGVLQNTTTAGAVGAFTLNYNSSTIPTSGSPYTITYAYAGNTWLKAAPTNTSTTLTVSASPGAPTTTGAQICIGSTATLSASGATAGQIYHWYDAATGGTLLKTSTNNGDNTYTTITLVSTTNFYVSIMNAGSCDGPRAIVTATYPSVSTDTQTPGADSWIGYVYHGHDTNYANNIYYGHYTETESFNENFGGPTTCFSITSNSATRSIYTDNFSVRYLMTSSKKGLWTVDMGSDDGNRLTVDGTLIYNDWADHVISSHPGVLMSLNGASSLIYDYYDNGGGNQVYFQNLTQVLVNNLTTNTTQSIIVGNTGTAISGDALGTLPTGITLSGTGYQWVYSTTPGAATTNISGATAATFTPNATVAPFNVAGTYYVYRNAILSSANNVSPNPYVATNKSNAATITILGAPTITASTTSLSGFSYPQGFGPSQQVISFTVSGINLTTNIEVNPTDSFDISLTSYPSFVPQTKITLVVVAGVVATTTIYVQMKAGLAAANINPVKTISCTSDLATTKTLSCSGVVTPAPIITTIATLSGLSYSYTAGPSGQQSFSATGTNLVSNITVTPSSSFEISTTSGSGFVSTPLSVTTGTTIYVRMVIALGVGSYAENIVLSATSTNPVNVPCSGTVSPAPTITASTSALAGFIYSGVGPSAEQSFTVTGSNLTGNISITPPANFQISTGTGGSFVSTNPITLTKDGSGNVASTTIYVRLSTGTPPVTVAPVNLTLTSTGAISQNVTLSGKSVTTATIITSTNTLSGFIYSGAGPSAEQSFTVSAALLVTNNLTITSSSSNFEISTSTGASFTSSSPITISKGTGTINPTRIYVRLKSGLALGNYNGITLTVASLPVTPQVVTCSGTVTDAPTISASITGGGSVCPNTAVTLSSSGANLINYYWQGPNGFYSTLQNPSLGTLTDASKNGTYTVTGNALAGPNLITNGDFEQRNTGFGSSYTYRDSTYAGCYSQHLGCEGEYAVVAIPYNVHTSFTTNPDHTPAPGTMQMVINGAAVAGKVVWSQSMSVIANTSYQFTYWIQTVALPSPSLLQLYVNGVKSGPVYTADSTHIGTAAAWTQFTYNVSPGNTTVANLELINQNTAANGNDFALDDISIRQVSAVTSSVSLTVNPTVAVSVSISASINPLYSGGSVTFTAAPVNGGSSPIYQWKVNGTVKGTNSSTYTYIPATGDNIICILTSNALCTTGNPATSNQLTAITRTNFWRGTNGTDWGTATNWTGGYIPIPGNDVVYAASSNDYGSDAINDLVLDQNRTIGNLTNVTAKALIIPANMGLVVNNTIKTDGVVDRIYIKSSTTVANGSLLFIHPELNSSVNASVEMYSMASWSLTPADSIAQTRYKWQYFGIPLDSIVAHPTFDGSYVRGWHESGTTISNHWISLSNDSVLRPFYGYEICQAAPTTYVFQGTLVNSNFSSGQLAFTSGALYPGENIFANPYTAAIDVRQLTFGTQMEYTVYLYNTGSYGVWLSSGGATYNGLNPTAGQYYAIPKDQSGFLGVQKQVPSMQAMLVKALSASSYATFDINYNSVITINTNIQRARAVDGVSSSDKIGMLIDVKGAHAADRMWIFTEPNCTYGFDNGWDGPKMLGFALTPQIFAIGKDGNYQVNSVPDMNGTELGFQAGQDVEDTLTFTNQNLEKRYAGVFLLDLVENKTIDITTSGTQYAFMAESTPAPIKRFRIVTRPYEKNAADAISQVKIFSSKSSIFIQNLGNVNGECYVYDIVGHFLMKVPFNANNVTAINTNLIPGAYIAMAITGGEKVSKRLILQ
jgi:hypothetical protein